jgi:predicted peptidase
VCHCSVCEKVRIDKNRIYLTGPCLGGSATWDTAFAYPDSPSHSIEMVNALKECGGDVRLTLYPDLRHECWDETYANPELYEWFLQQSKGFR